MTTKEQVKKTNQLLEEFHGFLENGVDLPEETITNIELLIAYLHCEGFKKELENNVFDTVYNTLKGDDK